MTGVDRPGTRAYVSRNAVGLALLCLGLVWAVATLDLWTTDDAFISFRYAANLVAGKGLVFNAGERVEGYTNFLWTLWTAAGLGVGASAEAWTQASGFACFLAGIVLLGLNQFGLGRELSPVRLSLPVGALAAALHREWSVFATSGLETAAFTTLLLGGFLAVTWKTSSPRANLGGGLLFALAALTRPEGVLVAGLAGLFVAWTARPRRRVALAFAAGFLPLWLGFVAWRYAYYGDVVPNTYYAKSAGLSWYVQGWHYLTLYLEKYWMLAFGLILPAIALGVDRRAFPPGGVARRQAVLAAAIAAAYTLYVVRVGGDFMFARFLIPATPFLLILLDLGWLALFRARPAQGSAVAAVLLAGLVMTPTPVSDTRWRHGVADERAYYSAQRVAQLEHKAEVLGRYFEGLPARVAFYGDEARVVYEAGFAVAIESHAGLTEPEVAHGPLDGRGRVGHEKYASAEYLISRRKADITFSGVPQRMLKLKRYIPEVIVRFDDGVTGQLLHWNPQLVAALEGRGARIPPFPRMLDGYLSEMDGLPDERVADDYRRFERFYFDFVDDPARREPFLRRLGGPAPGVNSRSSPG